MISTYYTHHGLRGSPHMCAGLTHISRGRQDAHGCEGDTYLRIKYVPQSWWAARTPTHGGHTIWASPFTTGSLEAHDMSKYAMYKLRMELTYNEGCLDGHTYDEKSCG